jgi:hypothetical protein
MLAPNRRSSAAPSRLRGRRRAKRVPPKAQPQLPYFCALYRASQEGVAGHLELPHGGGASRALQCARVALVGADRSLYRAMPRAPLAGRRAVPRPGWCPSAVAGWLSAPLHSPHSTSAGTARLAAPRSKRAPPRVTLGGGGLAPLGPRSSTRAGIRPPYLHRAGQATRLSTAPGRVRWAALGSSYQP